MQIDPSKQTRLGFITGVVAKSKFIPFERIIFRATRGNMYLKQSAIADPVVDPATGEKVLLFPSDLKSFSKAETSDNATWKSNFSKLSQRTHVEVKYEG